MRLLFLFGLSVAFVIQQHHLNQERNRIALLIAAVEHHEKVEHFTHPELLEPCPHPEAIDNVYSTAGEISEPREQ